MVKPKEQMPHSQYVPVHSQGVGGGGLNIPVLWETFSVTLNLALSHLMPMWVKTGGSEKSNPSRYRSRKQGPETAFGKLYASPTSVIASVQWDWGYNGYKRPIAPGVGGVPSKARKGQPERSSGKTLPKGPATDAKYTQKAS